MSSLVAERLVDVVVTNGWLTNIGALVASRQNPPGRTPSAQSLELAKLWNRLSVEEATILTADIVDSATFSVISLIDHDFKNSGLHGSFEVDGGAKKLDSRELCGELIEAYRAQVAPHGVLRLDQAEGSGKNHE
ncbi:MAG: hypothetical protein J7498_00750 [Sphingobium sp.]|nr:hypothetical protein [Sphingobium sp.]